jgi:hypothetical protein
MARMRALDAGPASVAEAGHVFDVDETSERYQELLDRGLAEKLPPEDDPGRTDIQIAQAVVRGDPLTDPVDRRLAEDMGVADAQAKVALQDPTATRSDLDTLEERNEAQRVAATRPADQSDQPTPPGVETSQKSAAPVKSEPAKSNPPAKS